MDLCGRKTISVGRQEGSATAQDKAPRQPPRCSPQPQPAILGLGRFYRHAAAAQDAQPARKRASDPQAWIEGAQYPGGGERRAEGNDMIVADHPARCATAADYFALLKP